MQAHRSHLYQYLSNELKLPHWKVTLLYAVVQLCFGAIAVAAYQRGSETTKEVESCSGGNSGQTAGHFFRVQ